MDIENKEKNIEELDLWDLLAKVGTVVKNSLIYLLRRSLLLFTFIIVGCAYCIFQSEGDKKYYSSTVQFRSKNVNCALIISQIDALDGLLNEGKYEEVALILQVPKEELESIKSIKGLYALDANRDKYPDYADENEYVKKSPRDTTLGKMNDYFYLRLDVYSDKIFASISKSLKEYINRNEFLKRENDFALIQQEEMLKKLKDQVALLDSFQKIEYFDKNKAQSSTGQQLYFNDQKRLYHNDYLALYRQLQEAEKEQDLYSEIITLTQDFPPLTTPENSLLFYLKKHVWKFLLFGFLVVLFWDNRKFIISNVFGKKKKV